MRRRPVFRYLICVTDMFYVNGDWVADVPSGQSWSTFMIVRRFKRAMKLTLKFHAEGLPVRLEVDKKAWARKTARRKQWCGYKVLIPNWSNAY